MALIYRELAVEFPEARFVLTRRSSVDVWLASIVAHTNRSDEYWGHEAAYGATMPTNDPDVYRRFYADHLARVREYFASTDRLLEVCWETDSGWGELCAFFDAPVPEDVPFPHSGALATARPGATPAPARGPRA